MLVKKHRAQTNIGRTPATVDLRAPDVTRSDEMYGLVYQDLKRIARHHLRRTDAGTLCTTELLHEAFLKLGGERTFEGRAHFFGAASRAMRQVLVDFARRRNARKRRSSTDDITLSDGQATVPVRHRGTPPDLFAESRGAVVEGTWSRDGYFQATTILAKHSEEYKAPHDASQAGYKELLKTLRGSDGR